MSLDTGRPITRRSFLKKGLGLGVVILAVEGAGALLVSAPGCAAAPSADLTAPSSTDFNHSHNVTIPGAHLDRPPVQWAYLSDGRTHQHNITLSSADFRAIKRGGTVTVVSNSTGSTPHTHTWAMKMA